MEPCLLVTQFERTKFILLSCHDICKQDPMYLRNARKSDTIYVTTRKSATIEILLEV